MPTIHYQAAHRRLTEHFASTESDVWKSVVFDAMSKLQNGFFADHDFLSQKFWGAEDMVEAYAFLVCRERIFSGKVVSMDIPVGDMPHNDSAIETNNRILSSGLANLVPIDGRRTFECSALFVPEKGGGADDDGMFCFRDMLFHQLDSNNSVVNSHLLSGSVPLEVGYTSATKTLLHFGVNGVARWPYGSNTIRVYVRLRNWMKNDE